MPGSIVSADLEACPPVPGMMACTVDHWFDKEDPHISHNKNLCMFYAKELLKKNEYKGFNH